MKQETKIIPLFNQCTGEVAGQMQEAYCRPLTNKELEEKIYKLINITKQIAQQSVPSPDSDDLLIELQELEEDLM